VRMQPTLVGDVLYAASTDGVIGAYDAATGKTIWEHKSRVKGWFGWGDKNRKDAFYSGGPAVVGDLLVIGTLDGHVYGLNVKDGSQRWVSVLPSEVIDSPAIAGPLTIVRTQDGRVYGLDSNTGERRWVNDQGNVPLLSLRGNGPLLVANGVVFFGSDDGKLMALRLDNGDKLWEQKLATGEGRTDIERMNDADGSVLLDGSTLYASAYHGNLTAIDGPSGRPLWGRPFSTYTSMAVNGNSLFGANTDSEVWAFDKSSAPTCGRTSTSNIAGSRLRPCRAITSWLATSKATCIGCRREMVLWPAANACPRRPSVHSRSSQVIWCTSRMYKATSLLTASALSNTWNHDSCYPSSPWSVVPTSVNRPFSMR
jgi:outer membrane protein assembly factor BamB